MSHHAKCARSFQVQSRQDNHLKKIFCASSHRCGLFVVWNNQHFSDAQQHKRSQGQTLSIFKKTLFIFFSVFSTIFCPFAKFRLRPTRSNRFVYMEEMDSGRNINFTTPKSAGWAKYSIFPGLQKSDFQFLYRKRNFDFK